MTSLTGLVSLVRKAQNYLAVDPLQWTVRRYGAGIVAFALRFFSEVYAVFTTSAATNAAAADFEFSFCIDLMAKSL